MRQIVKATLPKKPAGGQGSKGDQSQTRDSNDTTDNQKNNRYVIDDIHTLINIYEQK